MRHGNISELDSALDTGFALVKTICDDADAWGEKKLGHHYVRISNKTIEIRGLWSRWERLNAVRMALVASGRDNADAITAAVEHFNNKLRLCRHRFDRYKKRGLLFRTVFQAAEKVLKVLKDVENAHTVLLVMGEEASSAVTASQKPDVKYHGGLNTDEHAHIASTCNDETQTSPARARVQLQSSAGGIRMNPESPFGTARFNIGSRQPAATTPPGSPLMINPLSKSGFVVQIPPSAGKPSTEGGSGSELPPSPIPANHNQWQQQSHPKPVNLQVSAPAELVPTSVLVMESDGTVRLGGLRYTVSWLPNHENAPQGTANAVLVPIQETTVSLSPLPADGQSFGHTSYTVEAATGPTLIPSGPEDSSRSNLGDRSHESQESHQPSPPPSPRSLIRMLAAANLSAADARQLLASFSPSSATAHLQSAEPLLNSSPTRRKSAVADSGLGGLATGSVRSSRRGSGAAVTFHQDLASDQVAAGAGSSRRSSRASRQLEVALETALTLEQDKEAMMATGTRRNLWYRLPPPSHGSNRPLASYRSPRKGNLSGDPIASSPIRRYHLSPSTTAAARGDNISMAASRLGRPDDYDMNAASQKKLDQLMDSCVYPIASSVYHSLMVSRAVRGGGGQEGAEAPLGLGNVDPYRDGPRGSAYGSPPAKEEPSYGYGDVSFSPASASQYEDTYYNEIGEGQYAQISGPLDEDSVRAYASELSSRAQQGDLEAMEELGSMVRVGLPGLPAQPEVARGLLMLAAQSGSATACQMLEEMYDTGEGDEAAMWAGSAEEYIV